MKHCVLFWGCVVLCLSLFVSCGSKDAWYVGYWKGKDGRIVKIPTLPKNPKPGEEAKVYYLHPSGTVSVEYAAYPEYYPYNDMYGIGLWDESGYETGFFHLNNEERSMRTDDHVVLHKIEGEGIKDAQMAINKGIVNTNFNLDE